MPKLRIKPCSRTDDDRRVLLLDLRASGKSYPEICKRIGGTPSGLRKLHAKIEAAYRASERTAP